MTKKNIKDNIPKSFKLFGQTLKVEYEDDVQYTTDATGLAKYRQNIISLQPSTKQTPLTQSMLKHNFFHELTHFLLNFAGEEQFDPPLHQREYLVDRIAGLLHQAIETMEF